jgi:small subunit ribosomal protein S15
MALSAARKQKIIQEFGLHEKDSGSPESQVALFTEEIKRLAKHLEKHKKDHSSRRGILRMVSKRRRLLEYLKREFPTRYETVAQNLGLKK